MTLESLHSVLDALVPKCSELVAGCQTGSGAILRSANCCRLLFEDKLVYRYVLTKFHQILLKNLDWNSYRENRGPENNGYLTGSGVILRGSYLRTNLYTG
jgi:hypothetical protein